MDLNTFAEIATIIGSLSIFLTLIFVVIELKENVTQTKLANRSNRDLLHSEWVHFWSDKENAALVIKGREDFDNLNQYEKFQFEQFIEQRIRLFWSAHAIVEDQPNLEILNTRAKDFFAHSGSMACYQNLKDRKLVPVLWMNYIELAFKS